MKLLYSAGLLVVRPDSKCLKHIEFMLYSAGSTLFETFETHRIHVQLVYNAGVLVVQTDLNTSNPCEATL